MKVHPVEGVIHLGTTAAPDSWMTSKLVLSCASVVFVVCVVYLFVCLFGWCVLFVCFVCLFYFGLVRFVLLWFGPVWFGLFGLSRFVMFCMFVGLFYIFLVCCVVLCCCSFGWFVCQTNPSTRPSTTKIRPKHTTQFHNHIQSQRIHFI